MKEWALAMIQTLNTPRIELEQIIQTYSSIVLRHFLFLSTLTPTLKAGVEADAVKFESPWVTSFVVDDGVIAIEVGC